ncbi:MAG: c-type cytochrome [Pseudomonadota bacterium]
MRVNRLALWIGCFTLLGSSTAVFAQAPAKPAATQPAAPKPSAAAEPAETPPALLPEWLFPIDPASLIKPRPNAPPPPKPDDVELLGIPDSTEKYTAARIGDLYNPPDWHPNDHIPLPEIVAHGRKPLIIACGFCHTPTGQGRPENSALAGLPEAYIKEQLQDFRSGARQPVGPEAYKPSRGMHVVAKAMTDAEIDESAKYFSQQKLGRRVWVIEGIRIPRAEPAHWVYEEVGGTEDLGDRMLEVAPDIERHERRDDKMQYTAYVSPGSIARGKRLVSSGDGGKTQICATCHLANLKGTDKIPPISGRSPTYVLRQLLAFKIGSRGNEASKQMTPVVEKLELTDMIDIAAYLATLYPQ